MSLYETPPKKDKIMRHIVTEQQWGLAVGGGTQDKTKIGGGGKMSLLKCCTIWRCKGFLAPGSSLP